MIKQSGQFKNITFEQGAVLKIIIADEGTKNVYIGKFLYFIRTLGLFGRKKRTYLVFRHHTLCYEGLFLIEDNDIIDIKILKEQQK